MPDERNAEVRLKVDNAQYNQGIKESTTATEKFNAALNKTSETASKIVKTTGKGLLKIGAAEIAGLTALSAVAATLEKQTSNIQANLALNKASSQYNVVTTSIREMSRTMPLARAEIAAMATEVSNLGFVSDRQIKAVTSQFSKMGIATGESATGLASSMVQFQRAMGVSPSAQTMLPYQQAVTGVSARAGVNATDVLQFAGNIAPAARVAGLNQSTVIGLSAAAQRAGVEGQYASSTISAILNDITRLRYTQSPELRRYSGALGMNLQELQGPVKDTDAFYRNIITKILEVSQSAEGPTRLGMLGFEGLRTTRALQGLASEKGGVEQMIRATEAGMGQKNIEVGFEAASKGLTDQLIMLRNRLTDIGQSMGEPMMRGFSKVAEGANKAAGALQPFTDAITMIVGKLGAPIATLTMIAGGLLLAWKTISTLTLGSRLLWSTGTKSFVGGAQDAQAIMAGRAQPLSAAGERLTDPTKQSTWLQRGMYMAGGAVGGVIPGADIRQGVGQGVLRGFDRFAQWAGRGTQEFYARANMEPFARYEAKMAEREAMNKYRDDERARQDARERAVRWRQAMGQTQEQAERATPRYTPMPVPTGARGVPLGYTGDPNERLTTRGVFGGMLGQIARTPLAAGQTAAGGVGAGFRALGTGIAQNAFIQPWQNLQFQRQAVGGWAPLASAYAGAAPGAAMAGLGRLGGMGAGLMGGIGSLMSPQMMAMMGTVMAISMYKRSSEETARWREGGQGFSGEITNSMTKYNEKLGLATSSLERFATAVDEAHPAGGKDVRGALLDEAATYRRGAESSYQMVDDRIKMFAKNTEALKSYLASKGPLNADQLATIFTDLGKVLSKSDWTQIRDWYLANSRNGTPSTGAVTGTGFAGSAEALTQGVLENRSWWQKGLGWLGLQSDKAGPLQAWDILGLQGGKTGQMATDFMEQAMSSGKFIGDTKDVAAAVKGELGETKESQVATTAIQLGKGAEALAALNKQYLTTSGEEQEAAKQAWYAAKNRLDEYMKIDLSGINPGENADQEIWTRIYEEAKKQSATDDELKAAIQSGLITPEQTFGGKSLNDFINSLSDKTVTTSIQQMLQSSKFAGMSKERQEELFGEGTLLEGMKVGITDPLKALAGSFKWLKIAQDEYGGSVAEVDIALQSLKSTLTQDNPNWGLISGAQQLNQLMAGAYFQAGASPEMRGADYLARVQGQADLARTTTPPTETASNLMALQKEGTEFITNLYTKITEFGKQRERAEQDHYTAMSYAAQDFYLSQEYAEEDYHRSVRRSKAAFHRQMVHSEAAFQRSLAYQQEDFNRQRLRDQQAHDRQLRYQAEDAAKTMGDPYNRLQLQMLNDPASMMITMQNRLDIINQQTANINKLKGRGLSDEAIRQMGLAEFGNAQQTQHLANTMTDEDIEKFNQMTRDLIGAAQLFGEKSPDFLRSEQERDIALTQGLQDFLRGLQRTKIEHEIQVKFSKKEFRISLSQGEEDFRRALGRAQSAYNRSRDRANAAYDRQMQRQYDDLVGFLEAYATTEQEMVETIQKFLGTVISKGTAGLNKQLQSVQTGLGKIKDAMEWMEEEPERIRRAWERAFPQGENYKPPEGAPGSPTGRPIPQMSSRAGGGEVHGPGTGTSDSIFAMLSNGEFVVNANAYAKNKDLVQAINKGDVVRKYASGGMVGTFKVMPRTPAANVSNTVNTYDHSQTVSIQKVEVAHSDPRHFIKELEKEATKKRAALYKS